MSGLPRPYQLNLCLSEEEVASIEAAAAAAGLTRAHWLRVVARVAAGLGDLAEQVERASRAGEEL